MSLFLSYLLMLKFAFITNGHFLLGLEEDSICTLSNGNQGICKRLETCDSAIRMLMNKQRPIICGFNREFPLIPIVCCAQKNRVDPFISLGQLNNIKEKSTTEIIQKQVNFLKSENQNHSIKKSIQKCEEYKEIFYNSPLKSTTTTTTTTTTTSSPNNDDDEFHIFVVNGTDSDPKEFPHVALLGYGDLNNVQWLCGGALISENFILTAAHCLTSNDYGPVKIVRLGDLDIKSDADDAYPRQYQVVQTFQHPEYNPVRKYHDVALIRLNSSVDFNIYIKPACLHVDRELPLAQLVATGWGKTSFGGDSASVLQKVDLNPTDYRNCIKTYNKRIVGLDDGLNENWQICAEGAWEGGDTCQGDSGTPLQYLDYTDDRLYKIAGITSFGINCGLVPGVYTRVSFYVPWIENIVWG